MTGVERLKILAEKYKSGWIMTSVVTVVTKAYEEEKKGYNYRMCCLYSLSAVMPMMSKDDITQHVVPLLVKACKDEIPNVKFCVARVINAERAYIDHNVFSNQLSGPLKEMANDPDRDVAHFA